MVISSHAHSKTVARPGHTSDPACEFIDRIKQSMQRAEGLLVGPLQGLAPEGAHMSSPGWSGAFAADPGVG
jgi:hypothetical protein